MNKKEINISSIDVAALREKLRWGDCAKIARRTGYTDNYVYRVLDPNDKRVNKDIIQEAINIIEEGEPKVLANDETAKALVA